jgi:hypothetical protein
MSEYRYTLEKTGKKLICPSCNQKRYTRFVDTDTGEYLPYEYGRCDRSDNCTYHNDPYKDGYSKMISDQERGSDTNWKPKPYVAPPPRPKPQTSYIKPELFKSSLTYQNHFLTFLNKRFGVEKTDRLIEKYLIGDSDNWNGATVFWQIDQCGKIRSGKVMLYNPETGKRVKEPYSHLTWIHKVSKLENFTLEQCYYGVHLLNGNTKPVAIVESEKTAIVASLYLPQYVWLSCGSLTNLNAEKCRILKGRTVTLFPDLKGFHNWSDKQTEISRQLPEIRFTPVSDLLERKASDDEKVKGWDLADYLLKFDPSDFVKDEPRTQPPPIAATTAVLIEPLPDEAEELFKFDVSQTEADQGDWLEISGVVKSKPKVKECWTGELAELESYFSDIRLPITAVKLDPSTTVTNVSLFIESHFATTKANNGKRSFLPYLHRLQQLKQIL